MSISERLFKEQKVCLMSCCVLQCHSSIFMVSLFISYIWPVMNFCSKNWNVSYLSDIRLFDSVQRRHTRDFWYLALQVVVVPQLAVERADAGVSNPGDLWDAPAVALRFAGAIGLIPGLD